MNIRSVAAAVFLLAFSVTAISAGDAAGVSTSTRSVAVFKNGLGFFVRQGEAKLNDGWAVSEIVPAAALGTFWVGSPKADVRIDRLVACEEEESISVPAVSIQELLAANVGKRIRLMADGERFEGVLLSVPDSSGRRSESPIVAPVPVNYRSAYSPPSPIVQPESASLAILKTDMGVTAFNRNTVKWLEVMEPANTDCTWKRTVKRMKFKVSGAASEAPVTMAYLQKGITWAPGYLIQMIDEKTARITMQGLLANDVEDLEGADVSFVVGYPNFMFSDVTSPLALTQSVSDFVRAISGGRGSLGPTAGGIAAQSLSNTAFEYNYNRVVSESFDYSTSENMSGTQNEDLFLYDVKDVHLKRGERAYYTVFSAELPYEHVYEWQIPDLSGVTTLGRYDHSRREQRIEDQVWHKLRLTNKSRFPWTTAPALVMSGSNPLAQDKLDYTPKDAFGEVRLTVAVDVKAKSHELETGRVNNAIVINSSSYSKITCQGTLTLKSFKDRPVTVRVKKTIIGSALSSDNDGKVELVGQEIRAVNPTSVITWEVDINPGEEKTLEYTYFTYVN